MVDPAPLVVCAPPSGSTFALGDTTVACTATDASGNHASASFDVVVHDTTPPVLSGVSGPITTAATSAAGAIVSFTLPTALDLVDGPVAGTCDRTSGTTFPLGATTVACTATDAHGNTAHASFGVSIADTTGPALALPTVVRVEATSPLGAAVTYSATATDVVSGPVAVLCAPPSGSGFALGTTPVRCSASDAAGNPTTSEFPVVVVDTTAPFAEVTSPSADALVADSTRMTVVVHATDVVGVTDVTVNGVAATFDAGTAQNGTWHAVVPITLPVLTGGALTFDVVTSDAGGNHCVARRVVDTDGIASAIDRDRAAGADLSGVYSNDFNNGPTEGTIVNRAGWTMTVAPLAGSPVTPKPSSPPSSPVPAAPTWPSSGWVQAAVSGSGGIAAMSACTGTPKQVWFSGAGQRAALACDAITGTIYVSALAAVTPIRVWKYPSKSTVIGAQLTTGQRYSTGSPATASPDNTTPIPVEIFQRDATDVEHVVGSFILAPGASVDVAVSQRADGRDDQVHFHVLRGVIPLSMGGRSRTLDTGTETAVPLDLTPPAIEVTRPRADARYLLNQPVAAAFACADAASRVETCEGTTPSGSAIDTAAIGTAAFAVVATDTAGNTNTTSVPYAVTYDSLSLTDLGRPVARGTRLPLALRLADARGVNRSAAEVELTLRGLVRADGTTPPDLPPAQFRFDAALGGYRLDVDTTGLPAGRYTLSFAATGDPVEHTIDFEIR
jgi:hypothetical protein